MDLIEEAPARRRRGQELEDALLDAAWDELLESGYAALTIDAVAARAGTSRTGGLPALADQTRPGARLGGPGGHEGSGGRPDTGTLRGDVIALLKRANETRLGFAAVLSVQLGQYFQETGTGPADLRELMIGDRATALDDIIERAVARGEIDPRRAHAAHRGPAVRPVPAGGPDDAQAGAARDDHGDRGHDLPAPRRAAATGLRHSSASM